MKTMGKMKQLVDMVVKFLEVMLTKIDEEHNEFNLFCDKKESMDKK
jgi:hypothetical protein